MMRHIIIYYIMYLWQLPQNILGLVLARIYKAEFSIVHINRKSGPKDIGVWVSKRIPGGISLGRYIIVSDDAPLKTCHEYGHQRQSRYLGWLYLPVVGLWSGVRCGMGLYKKGRYFDAFPEDWADRLGGIRRDVNGRRYIYMGY